ncbi:MAG TPA: hypothetical protein ENH41_03525 [Candidatus Omnitrophica bacterium]|nr:hypothetical protein [Candidatus Omnitrophota bacterium]
MGWIRKDLDDPNLSAEDRAAGEQVLKNFMANDTWTKKIFKDVGILLTSHPGNRPYLKGSVESHKKTGYWICLSYDNYINPEHAAVDYNSIMPSKDVMDNIDTFVMPHHQTWGGVLFPYFWLLKVGINTLLDFKYIYCANGDCILEKPENFHMLIEKLGDADILGCGPVKDNSFNTAGMFAKTSALKAMIQHFQDHFIPFEVYEKYTLDIGNTEGRFAKAIKDLGLKVVTVSEPCDEQMGRVEQGWWYENLGFKHIHALHNIAYRYKGIPPHHKYLDNRFVGGEYETIKKYHETGDKKLLEEWWVKS